MPSLQSLKLQIAGIHSTKKITKAMELTAAARLKQINVRTINAKRYLIELASIIYSLYDERELLQMQTQGYSDPHLMLQLLRNTKKSAHGEINNNLAFEENYNISQIIAKKDQNKRHLILLLTSDRGLCGQYNSHVTQYALKYIQEQQHTNIETEKCVLLCLGNRGEKIIKNLDHPQIKNHGILYPKAKFLDFTNINQDITIPLLQISSEQSFDQCTIIYNKAVSILFQKPIAIQLFPINDVFNTIIQQGIKGNINKKDQIEKNFFPQQLRENFTVEPNKKTMFSNLLSKYIGALICYTILDAKKGEYTARRAAMGSASKNSEEMLDEREQMYNKIRQGNITKELMELTAGSEALKES